MQDNTLLDAVERYIRGEMLPEERQFFEHVRTTNPEVDQLVIEHTLFLKQFMQFGENARLKSRLQDVHERLSETGEIGEGRQALVVTLWKKYKRVVFVAASIAGITALMISGLITILSPKVSPDEVDYLKGVVNDQNKKINNIAKAVDKKDLPVFEGFGTGFLIDGKGYLITNAHVVRNAREIDVQNTLGIYHARLIRLDPVADLALLKIDDTLYHAFNGLPYGISKSDGDLGEDLFTLGYPRPEIVYNKGYLSASTGFQEDTTAFQLTIAANPGNSGTPVFNNDGEVIGVVNSVQHNAQGMVFAVRAKNIFRAVDSIKADSTLQSIDSTLVHLRVPQSSALKGVDRRTQIKRIEDYVFIVKIK